MKNKEICTFEQSQTLKRLGFNDECNRYYINGRLSPTIMYRNHNDKKFAISAPLVTTAAAYLREEIGADIVVSPRFNSKTGERIGYFWRWSQRTDVIDEKIYRTFEGALSAGVSKVLKPFIEEYERTDKKCR